MIPDWQLPAGVDRGLWDYVHSADMVGGYDEQMRASPLAAADAVFCERAFPRPGRLLDLGCGTGRLCNRFAARGYECVGVDLSAEMLARARANWMVEPGSSTAKAPDYVQANLVELSDFPAESFDYAACLFSTLGMIRGVDCRVRVVENAHRLLRPGGRFVLHAHNRYFQGLGWGRVLSEAARSLVGATGDITMAQAYGGAPLTLHHFSKREVVRLLCDVGFEVQEVLAAGSDGVPVRPWWRVYGWLILGCRG